MVACACSGFRSSPTSAFRTHWNRRACRRFSRSRVLRSLALQRWLPASFHGSDHETLHAVATSSGSSFDFTQPFTHVASLLAHMTAPQVTNRYPLLPDGGADALEQEMLARWESERLFETVQAARAGAK